MKSLLRWWLTHPWTVWLALLAAAALLAILGLPPVIVVAPLAGAWLCVIQGLRLLWQRVRWQGAAVALLLLVVAALPLADAQPEALGVAAAVFGPVPLAVASGAAIAWLRRRRERLWLDAPVGAVAGEAAPGRAAAGVQPEFWCRHSGCLGLVLLVLSAGVWGIWKIGVPGRNASATQAELTTGMSASRILAAARGGFRCTVVYAPEAKIRAPRLTRVWTWDGHRYEVTLGEAPGAVQAMDRAAFLHLLDAAGEAPGGLGDARAIYFSFMTPAVPPRRAFAVQLDDQGRLASIGPSQTWD